MKRKGGRIVGISTDDLDTLRRFKEKVQADYPLLSDDGGKVARQYVGVMPVVGLANRGNVVVAQDGTVKELVHGSDAIDPSAAVSACPAKAGGSG